MSENQGGATAPPDPNRTAEQFVANDSVYVALSRHATTCGIFLRSCDCGYQGEHDPRGLSVLQLVILTERQETFEIPDGDA